MYYDQQGKWLTEDHTKISASKKLRAKEIRATVYLRIGRILLSLVVFSVFLDLAGTCEGSESIHCTKC
jgi:hypothetical protein